MKLKDGLVLRDIAGECVVVSVDSNLDFDGMITLNSTAKTLWLEVKKGADENELINKLLEEYEVDENTARVAVEGFIKKLSEMNFLE